MIENSEEGLRNIGIRKWTRLCNDRAECRKIVKEAKTYPEEEEDEEEEEEDPLKISVTFLYPFLKNPEPFRFRLKCRLLD